MAGDSGWLSLSLSLSLAVFSTERERRQTEEEGGDPNTTPSCQLEALRGRDGRDGVNGRDGRDGIRGEKGDMGNVGPPGEKGEVGEGERGEKGEVGGHGPQGISGPQGAEGAKGERGEKGDHGSQGLHGPQGFTGPTGPQGEKGDMGERGEKGDCGVQGPAYSGGLYIRWGRTSCPNVTGTELVYSGRAGGSSSGSDFMCLPDDPEYSSSSATGSTRLSGVEYNTHPAGFRYHNAPCAVCYSSLRPTIMMIPAKLTCPSNWTSEYTGYLMITQAAYGHSRNECVDQSPESIPGLNSRGNGIDLYSVYARYNNGGLSCPPYSTAIKALTCVVCSR